MSKERELLKRVLDGDADRHWTISSRLYKKIEEVLTQPEPKRKPLSDEAIAKLWGESYSGTTQMVRNFARAIEQQHGITGVDDE